MTRISMHIGALLLLLVALPARAEIVVGSVLVDEATKTLTIRGSGFVTSTRKPLHVYAGSPSVPLVVQQVSPNEVTARWTVDFAPGSHLLTVGYGLGPAQFDQVWISMGGTPGPAGPAGPKGDKGDPGPAGQAIASLSDLSGTACSVGGSAGTIQIDVAVDGAVSLFCALVNPRLMFVSSTVQRGNLGGLAGADSTCQSLATAAGLGGAFRAWLSTAAVKAIDRFVADSRPIATVSLAKIASSLADLSIGSLASAPNQDEHGAVVSTESLAWTGTITGGEFFGSSCQDWSSVTQGNSLVGNPHRANSQWTQFDVQSCAAASRLYCIGP